MASPEQSVDCSLLAPRNSDRDGNVLVPSHSNPALKHQTLSFEMRVPTLVSEIKHQALATGMSPALHASLQAIAETAVLFRDEWWVIGSAAAVLAGAESVTVHDVDLLLSERDAQHLKAYWSDQAQRGPQASAQFRSAVFSCFEHTPLAIEAFGGFEILVRGQWRAFQPLTRVQYGAIHTPSIAEQLALLEIMNRDKDHPRMHALRALLSN